MGASPAPADAAEAGGIPVAPVSALLVHAVDDAIVAYGGGNARGLFEPDRVDLPVEDAVALWLEADGLAGKSPTTSSGLAIRQEWTGGLAGTDVVLVTRSGGHPWDGPSGAAEPLPTGLPDLEVTPRVADFFLDHAR